jgi:hypothetical protein
MLKHPPVFPAWYTPQYSNFAYQLLGYAMEAMSNKTFEQVMHDNVWNPLKLTRSSDSVPTDQSQVIRIPGNSIFNWSLADETPAGNFYMSIADSSTHLHSVLNHKQLKPVHTRKWLKPISHTADPLFSIGMPWEILRVVGDKYHTIDVYTKAGGIDVYSSQYGIYSEYDVGYNILAVGDGNVSARALETMVHAHVLPALYRIARKQANLKLGGTYAAEDINSSLTIGVDEELGMVVQSWISNGTDMVKILNKYSGGDGRLPRIYPAALATSNKIAFRIAPQRSTGCYSWSGVDNFRFGLQPMDSILFQTDANGYATNLVLPAFRANLTRTGASQNGDPKLPEHHWEM